ncbi:DMT family transporter [Saccharospirillum mangrovi]|uniref:DMT family transporter n=1 Tax=Saccharospirillum mangrovi TaxID=2161747 RepID=UPI000D3DBEE1|nr:DMT family transporter [Saccharospirillum mangrovi]
MSAIDAGRLLLLSTLWGVSFLFMRVAAPEFGPVALIFVRMGVAALVLLPILSRRRNRELFVQYAGRLAVLSITNHVVPFSLLAWATLSLEAGFTSLINATTPLFTALIGAALFATPVQRQQYLGLAIAFVGVYVLSANRLDFSAGGDGWAIVAALAATFSYGIAGNFSKAQLAHLPAQVVASGSTLMSALILLIPGVLLWPDSAPSAIAWGNVLALAVFSTALAFFFYFQLLASAGATATSTVTFLVPVSALAWGYLILGEVLSVQVWVGMAITLLGTAITTRLIRLRKPKAPAV